MAVAPSGFIKFVSDIFPLLQVLFHYAINEMRSSFQRFSTYYFNKTTGESIYIMTKTVDIRKDGRVAALDL